jgi:hypothetical protein
MSERPAPNLASHQSQPPTEQLADLGGNQIPDQMRELIAQQKAGFEKRGLEYAGGNMLAMVHTYNRFMQHDQSAEYRQGLVESAVQAKTLATEMQIDDPVDPGMAQNLLSAGIHKRDSDQPQQGTRPLAYETIEDRQMAADQLIDERLAQADSYPYYDLYRQHGMLHEDEGSLPYVELYRNTNGDHSVQLAGGIRSGLFTTDELMKLPPSVRLAATEGAGSTAKVAQLEGMFSLDQVEAYTIGDSGHNYSAYLSASRADTDKFGGDTVLKLRVPACLTLPVEFLQAPVERHVEMLHSHQTGRPPEEPYEDMEKEIAILGGIRPEWIVGQRVKPVQAELGGAALAGVA